MSLRIIGGAFRNRPIRSPKGEQTRPTLAITRKAVFDILQSKIEESSFLDIFAGSGAMGLEALSRGASFSTFIDRHPHAIRCIEENLHLLEVEDRGTVLPLDALTALKKCAAREKSFDIVYIDPPYQEKKTKGNLLVDILQYLDESPLVPVGGIIFAEEAVPGHLLTNPIPWRRLILANSRTFSRSVLHQFWVET